MEYKVNRTGYSGEVVISGQITYRDHDDFFEATSFINDNKTKECIVNLASVDFVDSAGLGMFLILNDTAQKNNMNLIIKGAKNKVKNIIEATKLNEVLIVE
ncbi:MAG: STAS domain-containing protein [Alphaproteobacteria bacterium]